MNNSFEECLKHLRNFHSDDNIKLVLSNIEDNNMMLLEHRNNHLTLTKKFECIYNSENIKTTNEYIILQEKLKISLQNKTKFAKQLNNLNNDISQDIKQITEQYENEINVQIGLEELKLENLQRQINEEQEKFNAKEKDLRNDLELLQATMALEIDELETDMYKETVDLNMRIRQIQNINIHLQEEIDSINQTEKKEQVSSVCNNNYHITTTNQVNDPRKTVGSTKLNTIERRKKKAELTNISDCPMNTIAVNPKTFIPKKKRKLFDPDDLTYLENLELKD